MIQSTQHRRPTNGQARASSGRRQIKRRTWRVVSSVAALLTVIVIIVSASKLRGDISLARQADTRAPHAVTVDAFQPTVVASYQVTRSYSGTLVARRKTDLGFERPGKVVRVLFDVGQNVDAGAPLALLDVEHLKKQREELVARQQQTQSVLDELIAGPRHETIMMAKAEVSRLASLVELLEIQLVRRKRLLDDHAVSRDEHDVTNYSLQARRAELAAAKHKLSELNTGTRPEQIAAQEAALKQLSIKLATVDLDLEKSILRAPFAGKISARFMDEGKVTQAGAPVFQLLEAHLLEAWIGVPPRQARRIVVGNELPVTVDGIDYKARVSAILPTVDLGTHTQTIVLSVTEAAGQGVADGQLVRLQLETRVAETGMWIPTTALEKSSHGAVVVLRARKEQRGQQ